MPICLLSVQQIIVIMLKKVFLQRMLLQEQLMYGLKHARCKEFNFYLFFMVYGNNNPFDHLKTFIKTRIIVLMYVLIVYWVNVKYVKYLHTVNMRVRMFCCLLGFYKVS